MSDTSFQGRVPHSDPQGVDQQCANQSEFTQSCAKDDNDIDKDKKTSDHDTNNEKEQNMKVKESRTKSIKDKFENLRNDNEMRHLVFASSFTTEGRLLRMSVENDQKVKTKALEDKAGRLERQHKDEIQALKAEIQALNDQAKQSKKKHLFEIENLKTKLNRQSGEEKVVRCVTRKIKYEKLDEDNQDLIAEIATTPIVTKQMKNQHSVEEFAERNHQYRKDYIAAIKANKELKQHGRELTLAKFKECGMQSGI